MDTITISGAAVCTALGLAWQFARVKAEHAARMAVLEQRVMGLEARAKSVDTTLELIRAELQQLREMMARLEGHFKRTPAPR
jgi:chromosome segregation ATPase